MNQNILVEYQQLLTALQKRRNTTRQKIKRKYKKFDCPKQSLSDFQYEEGLYNATFYKTNSEIKKISYS
jgi:hypothetical protein